MMTGLFTVIFASVRQALQYVGFSLVDNSNISNFVFNEPEEEIQPISALSEDNKVIMKVGAMMEEIIPGDRPFYNSLREGKSSLHKQM